MPTNKTQPWKETRPTRCIRFSDTEWEAIDKAARAAKKTKADFVRDAVLPALMKLGLLALMLISLSCGGRTDLEPVDIDMGGRTDLFVPLGSGIRTDIADALLPLGHDLEAENVQFDQTGSLVKRFGHLAQGVTVQPGGGALPQTWQLGTHQGARVALAVPAAAPLGIYSPADTAWNQATSDRRGPINTVLTKLKAGGNNPRIAAGAGFYYLLYLDLQISGLMHFDVVDATTGHVAVAQTFLAGGLVLGHDVLFCNGFAVAVTMENAVGIVFHRMTPSTKTFTTTTFAATFAARAFDAIVANATTISVAYSNNVVQAAGVDFVPSTSTTTGFAIKDATAANISLDLERVAWMVDTGVSGKIALITASTVQGVRTQWDLSAGATRTALITYTTDPAATANIGQLTGFTTTSSAVGTFVVLHTITASIPTNCFTKWGGAIAGINQTASVLYRSLTLLAKPWTAGGDFFAMFAFPSFTTGDGNSYVMRIPVSAIGSQPALSAPQAQFAVRSSGNIDQFGIQNLGLTRVLSLSATQFITSISYLNRIGQQADSFFSGITLGIELVTVSHLQPAAIPTTGAPVEAVDSLLVPGGTIAQFDGATFAEMGFAYSPQAPILNPTTAGGSLSLNSTYWYVIVYVYMDAQGRLWRSGTSVPTPRLLTGTDNTITVQCSTLRVTGRTGIGIEIYRGAANDENLFQKLGQVPNDITVDIVNFTDTFSDAALAIGEDLYTGANNNAILNNDTIPGSPFIFVFQNRVWFISADDPTELWFSNVISPGNGPRFNSQNVVRLADAHGPTIAAAVMDDKVVAFKADAIYSWNGDGPDDAGNGSYSSPLIVSLGVGTTNPRGVVSTKEGVFFDGTAARPGMQLINHGLAIETAADGSAFGAAVQKYANEQIMAAIQIPEQSQARFYCLSGRVLVYDLLSKQWVTFLVSTSGNHIISAIATSGAAVIALDNLGIWLEDTSGATYTDAGAFQGERIASPWISVDGIGGFQRLIQMIGRGQTLGNHTLTVQEYVNFDDSLPVGQKTWAETVALTPLWNWEWNRPRVARMSSLKLVVSEVSNGPGFKAEGVSLTLGVRSGLNRQPTTTRGP